MILGRPLVHIFMFSYNAIIHTHLSQFHRYAQKGAEEDDVDNAYFRRKPTSFLSSNDAKRYTWMPADEDSVRLEGPRPIRPQETNGPYIVGSYPPKTSFLSQSNEQITNG